MKWSRARELGCGVCCKTFDFSEAITIIHIAYMSGPERPSRMKWNKQAKGKWANERRKRRVYRGVFCANTWKLFISVFSSCSLCCFIRALICSSPSLCLPFWVIDGQTERITRLLTFEMKSNHSIWCRKKLNFSLSSHRRWGRETCPRSDRSSPSAQHGPTHISDFSMYISRISHFIISDIFMLFSPLLGWVVVQFARLLFSVEVRMKFLGGNCVYFKIWIGPTRAAARTGRTLLWEHWEFAFSHFSFRRKGKKTRKQKWKFSFVYLAKRKVENCSNSCRFSSRSCCCWNKFCCLLHRNVCVLSENGKHEKILSFTRVCLITAKFHDAIYFRSMFFYFSFYTHFPYVARVSVSLSQETRPWPCLR